MQPIDATSSGRARPMQMMKTKGMKLVRNSGRKLIFSMCLLLTSASARASWFSDATGVNIDVPHGRVQVGPPQPIRAIQQLPGEIVRLPQTLANAGNPGGMALVFAIRQANEQARNGCRSAPAEVRSEESRVGKEC